MMERNLIRDELVNALTELLGEEDIKEMLAAKKSKTGSRLKPNDVIKVHGVIQKEGFDSGFRTFTSFDTGDLQINDPRFRQLLGLYRKAADQLEHYCRLDE